jgi:hypothetical protein
VHAIIKEFNPVIISSQLEYNLHKNKLRNVVMFEPGWAAPRIVFDKSLKCKKAVMYSDPHFETDVRYNYFVDNGFDYVLSLYNSPFFFHFQGFPEDKFVHFPWAVPDQFISTHNITVKNNNVAIFGGKNSDAYDMRNWCREQPCVTDYEVSGVENKKMTDEEYYTWLNTFDAVVAAGSSNPMYNLVTPKYFEIASSGALLIGQYCQDLELLGFNNSNLLLFTKNDFLEKIDYYKKQPEKFLEIREKGRVLIKQRHKLSDRIKLMREMFNVI